MAWLWRKKSKTPAAEAPAAAPAPAPVASEMMNPVVNAAAASSHRTDEDWRKLEAQQRKEQKRLQKEMEKEAKKAAKEMKEQVKKARKERAKVEKVAKKHARTVLKIQKKEQKSERKRAKTMMKATRAEEKRRKRLTRKRKREEKRRRKQMRQQDDLHHQLVQAEIETEEMRAQRDANAAVVTAMTTVAAAPQSTASGVTVVTLEAPKFKEDKSCKTCASNFQRLPTRRRHHCRNCGDSFCSKCLSKTKRPIPWFKLDKPQKVCFSCDVQVFNGVDSNGVLTSVPEAVSVPTASSPIQAPAAQPETEASPLRVQRAASFQSESPENDSPASSPSSRGLSPENDSPASSPSSRGLSFRLRPRSRRDSGGSSKGKKNKLWSLPLRPLLKRKASADQLRNRSWDLDLRIEKEEMLARQRRSQMIDLSSAPQFAQAS